MAFKEAFIEVCLVIEVWRMQTSTGVCISLTKEKEIYSYKTPIYIIYIYGSMNENTEACRNVQNRDAVKLA